MSKCVFVKSLEQHQETTSLGRVHAYFCSKKAKVTTPKRSRMGPNTGPDARTTTAFCTVERVISISLTRRDEVAIWRLHLDMCKASDTTKCAKSPTICQILCSDSERLGRGGSTNNLLR